MPKRRPDSPAARHAREVVGLYGDPDNTWGICAEFGLTEPVLAAELAGNLTALCAERPLLGMPPTVREVDPADWDGARGDVAAAPYVDGAPLVRVLLDTTGRRILVGAHHGVVDGLGLVAVAAAALGRPIAFGAAGIGTRPARHGFLRSSLGRAREAVFAPPSRFRSRTPGAGPGSHEDDLSLVRLEPGRRGTAALAHAVLRVFEEWSGGSRPLVVVGASRRAPGELHPDRQTAFLRVRLHPDWDRDQVRAALRSVPPEPDFPVTSVAGIGPRVTHLLRRRLGATALLSNLGRLEASGLDYVAMFPAASGPHAVAIGLASTPRATVISLHTRRAEFSAADHAALLEAMVGRFSAEPG
jgi:hypothetical protein